MLFISSNNMQATHMDSFSPKFSSGLSKTVSIQPWTIPSSSIQFHFFGTEMHGHSRPHNSQNHFHGFLDKNNRVGENPYHLEFVETSLFRSLLEALAARNDFLPLAPMETVGPIAEKLRKKVEFLSLKLSSFFLSCLSFLYPIPSIWFKMGQVRCSHCHMSTHPWLSWIFLLSTYP